MKLDLNKGYFCTYVDGVLHSVESIMWMSKTVVLKNVKTDDILPVNFEDLESIQWISI